MRFAGNAVRFLSLLGVFSIGLASVAQAASVDRKAARDAREKRVEAAVKSRSTTNARQSVASSGPDVVIKSVKNYVTRETSAAKFYLNIQKEVLKAENRLIAQQNRILAELNVATNPNKINGLNNTATALQTSIDSNAATLSAVQPLIDSSVGALEQFVGVVPGVAATYSRLVATAVAYSSAVDVIVARGPYGVPPVTNSI